MRGFSSFSTTKKLHTLEDKIFFREAKGGLFSASFVYQHLFDIEAHLFPSKLIWNSWVPTKVGFFACEASWGRILTLDQLKRRGRALANRCFPYEVEEETVEHLLLHCTKTKVLWNLSCHCWGVVGFPPHCERNSFILAWFLCGQKKAKGVDGNPPLLVLVHLA